MWSKGRKLADFNKPLFKFTHSQNRVNGAKINWGQNFPCIWCCSWFKYKLTMWNTSELFFSRRFSGLRSLWATLRLWHWYTASVIWRRYLAAFLSVNPLSLLILSNSSPPSINSITINKRALKIYKMFKIYKWFL